MSASLGLRILEAVQGFYEHNNISKFTRALKKIREEYGSLLEDEDEDEDEEEAVSSSSSKMIGLRDERSKLKEALFDYRLEEYVFLLAGMAGIGKTTLASEIYEDLYIMEWFECRAWVTLGNEWKSKEITEVILAQVDPDAYKMIMGGDEKEIAQRLKESLELVERFLIVVDDVWDYKVFWDYMETLMPLDMDRSRVMLTMRIKDSHFAEHNQWFIFGKRLLNEEESWDLLREKVFDGGSCPPQLEDTGKKIAEKCDGLPLTIVTVSDLL